MATADLLFDFPHSEPRRATLAGHRLYVSDAELVSRMKAGDETAVGTIYDRYSGIVYGVLMGVLRDSTAAEEVLRDLFVQLWRTAADFDAGRGSLPAWLMVMARNRALALVREAAGHEPGEDLAAYPAKGMPSPFEIEGEEQLLGLTDALRKGILALPQQHRQTVEMAFYEGLPQADMEWRTSLTRDEVKSQLLEVMESLINAYGRARHVRRV
ncbi:MAG TPA: sigma-70 family RNA polymerase sigma factor [Acidobacteriaceae bacterium]|jgi:RNA polymerase sigma-70 factor (ECF subfamily)|nr:sigma-70 family RNA polymerase sigma factor [Acidobacteriaceae bacterium]